MSLIEMDPRYRVEFICPACGKEFQITCPDSVETCICGAELEGSLEHKTGHLMRTISDHRRNH